MNREPTDAMLTFCLFEMPRFNKSLLIFPGDKQFSLTQEQRKREQSQSGEGSILVNLGLAVGKRKKS